MAPLVLNAGNVIVVKENGATGEDCVRVVISLEYGFALSLKDKSRRLPAPPVWSDGGDLPIASVVYIEADPSDSSSSDIDGFVVDSRDCGVVKSIIARTMAEALRLDL